jgi:2-dehydro-3-deoxyphosphogluconate aldolase/(4S)-4-hydroxy-2-oxoglutarate aldolase
MSAASVMSRLEHHGVVPVVRLPSLELAQRAVEGLAEAGFTTFEITMSVPGALELIAELAKRDGYLVGAGTVLSLEQARRCLDVGARYLVSPCLVEGLPGICREADAACLMGGLTPSEIFAVARAQRR